MTNIELLSMASLYEIMDMEDRYRIECKYSGIVAFVTREGKITYHVPNWHNKQLVQIDMEALKRLERFCLLMTN